MNRRFVGLKMVAGTAPDFWAGRVKQPIFVLGCARSGTTLLSTLLGLHNDVANWSEANDVWDPTGHPWRNSAKETPPVWIDPEAFMARWWRDAAPRQREIRAVFGVYQFFSAKAYFCNKTPYNTLRIPHLLKIFPDAKLINLTRDGRAVVHSYTRREIKKMGRASAIYDRAGIPRLPDEVAYRLAGFWKLNVEEVRRQDASLGLGRMGRLINLSYEELCGNTTGSLERLCAFIGLDPQKFDPRVGTVATPSQNNKWETDFDPSLVKRLVAIMQPVFSELGYEA